MEEKIGLLSCKCDRRISIYAFLLPILFIFVRYCHDEIIDRCKQELSYKLLKYNFPYIFYNNLPKVLSILCILIIKSNAKGEASSSEQNRISRNYHIIVEKENRKKFLLLFFFISLIEILQDDGNHLLNYYQNVIYDSPEKRPIKGWLIEKKLVISFLYLYFHILYYIQRFIDIIF